MTIEESLSIAVALGAEAVPRWTADERSLVRDLPKVAGRQVEQFRNRILNGGDPLGEEFCTIRSVQERRPLGATFTPWTIVDSMIDWARRRGTPAGIIDPGVGSGRFLLRAGLAFPQAGLIGVEIDPVPAVLARANLAVLGFGKRAEIVVGDFLDTPVNSDGPNLWIGNPPYVRHHAIHVRWKRWLSRQALYFGLTASQLAGLHVHFCVRTARLAKHGDWGTFITSSEWLDVNYGKLLRRLFLQRLGLEELILLEPEAMPFGDATTTGVITRFRVGTTSSTVYLKRANSVVNLGRPNCLRRVRRDKLADENRWTSVFTRKCNAARSMIQLGELCRVHRGQVTGANDFWLEGLHTMSLPKEVLFPSVTKAMELFRAAGVLTSSAGLRRVVDLPPDLEMFCQEDREAIDRFLQEAQRLGIHRGYIASHRCPWWSIRLREPAPILMTYMARRPPAFVRNLARARHINIAHGIYPVAEMSGQALDRLANYLSQTTCTSQGRTYAGGLTKFEPREVERLLIPRHLCHD
jgi:adenine-specific DNA-methyltransferase